MTDKPDYRDQVYKVALAYVRARDTAREEVWHGELVRAVKEHDAELARLRREKREQQG